jgi:hypothetical protein
MAMLFLPGCQSAGAPPPVSPADQAEAALTTFEGNADAACPKTALRIREAGVKRRELFQTMQTMPTDPAAQDIAAAAIRLITTGMVALAQLCKSEQDNCGTGPARLGMSTKEAIHTSWCFPAKKNTTETVGHMREQWVYPDRGYLYFDNGRLTTIQETP